MERKTMGSFIAVLRKANGMTQRELAEKLGVSDKTVSHWERDDSAPDISVIPVIAEIFDVTCDELLRGARITAESDEGNDCSLGKPGEKQLKYLLNKTLSGLKIRSFISIGLIFIGIAAAMTANFAFFKSLLGFFIALIFCITALICQICFTVSVFSKISEETLNCAELCVCKRKIINFSKNIIMGAVLSVAFSLPLAVFGDNFYGISFENVVLYGLLFTSSAAVVCAVLQPFITRFLIKKGLYDYEPDKKELVIKQCKEAFKVIAVSSIAVVLTTVGHWTFSVFVSADSFTYDYGIEFRSFEEFKEFAETPDDGLYEYPNTPNPFITEPMISFNEELSEDYEDTTKNSSEEVDDGIPCSYEFDGVLYEWVKRRDIYEVNWDKDDKGLLITVFTNDSYNQAYLTKMHIQTAFLGVYTLEILAGAAIYLIKIKRLRIK